MRKDPVVVLGMHRSGTTLLVSWLEALGVYMGKEQDANREALYMQRLNRRMMELTGASWLYPEPFLWWIRDPERRLFLLQRLRRDVRHTLGTAYGKPAVKGTDPWGWKDPRTVFTLELWRDVFPELRVVAVRRHGVDVAVSLRKRAERAWAVYRTHWEEKKGWPPAVNGLEPLPLKVAFELWLRYNQHLDHLRATWPSLPWMELRYEHMVRHPDEAIHQVAEFLDLPVDNTTLNSLVQAVDASRAWAFRSDPELQRFAARQAEALSRYGYTP